jgi:hypothetical protein
MVFFLEAESNKWSFELLRNAMPFVSAFVSAVPFFLEIVCNHCLCLQHKKMAKISDLLASLGSIDIVHIIQKKQFLLLVSINPCKFG